MSIPPRQIVLPAIQSAVTAEEAAALAALARGKTVLEMGAWHGYSTVVLGSVAEHVISVDWHHGDYHAGLQDTEAVFRANLDRYGVADRVRVIVERFEAAIPALAAEGVAVDGVFLDARHDSPSVEHDLGLALTVVKPGGFIAFHDYGRNASNGHPGFGVTEVADAFGISGSVGFLGWGFVPEPDADVTSVIEIRRRDPAEAAELMRAGFRERGIPGDLAEDIIVETLGDDAPG